MENSEGTMASVGGEHRLTEAELGYLRHGMDSEVLCLKKCLHYAQEVVDEQARDLLREQADIHHRRFDIMLALMEDSPGDITHQAKLLLQNVRPYGGDHHAQ